jgi:uncharacterized protein with PIN domain
MIRARFRFDPELDVFLRRNRRGRVFTHESPPTDTLTHVIESLGIPHTEIGAVTVNGQPVALGEPLPADSEIHISARAAEPLADPRFVLDGHLGRLAAYLRMLGFDAMHDRHADDAALAAVAAAEGRTLLTRDAGLLKRGEVTRGAFIRATDPILQLREVVERFGLLTAGNEFTRCLRCNTVLEPVDKTAVASRLPARVRERHEQFATCPSCDRVYWKGTHFDRMAARIRSLRGGPTKVP